MGPPGKAIWLDPAVWEVSVGLPGLQSAATPMKRKPLCRAPRLGFCLFYTLATLDPATCETEVPVIVFENSGFLGFSKAFAAFLATA